MTDLLTHVLAVYVLLTAASWRYREVRPYVPIGMVGAIIPDLAKARLVVTSGAIEGALGLPFSWLAIHRLGGVVVIAGLGAVCFDRDARLGGFLALLVGGIAALALDLGVKRASGLAPPYLYPVSWWQPPSADLYLSADPLPAGLALAVALVVWWLDRVSADVR